MSHVGKRILWCRDSTPGLDYVDVGSQLVEDIGMTPVELLLGVQYLRYFLSRSIVAF
jgi:hypothetical protein